ncbi:MAG: diguanylate cyclase [Burkholderiales bacterium]
MQTKETMETKVLLITANAANAGVISKALADGQDESFSVQHLDALPNDIGWVSAGKVAVVLLDLQQPDVQGIGVLDRLIDAAPQVPILVFGGKGEDELARQAVSRGALDHLPRAHLDNYTLPRALRNAIERKSSDEALFMEKERAQVTLDSIGDAVLSTDAAGMVTYLNSVAEGLVGWSRSEASGKPLKEVLQLVDGTTREPPSRNPMELAMSTNSPVALAANSVLLRRDGTEVSIEDTAAPIHGRDGSVIGAVMVFHDVGASRKVMAKMSHLAQHDFLTDLPNPVLLGDRIARAIALARRHDKQFAVLFLDLDRFKKVNDDLGHDAGDQLLQSVARRLTACVRESDSVCRKGGDEFVVLLADITHAEHAARSAAKIITAFTAAHQVAGRELVVTASIGIAIYPQDGADADALLKAADAAMYLAKEGGRNQYRFYRGEPKRGARERHGAPEPAFP